MVALNNYGATKNHTSSATCLLFAISPLYVRIDVVPLELRRFPQIETVDINDEVSPDPYGT